MQFALASRLPAVVGPAKPQGGCRPDAPHWAEIRDRAVIVGWYVSGRRELRAYRPDAPHWAEIRDRAVIVGWYVSGRRELRA